jgi:methylated-DNA-[protein]-cysteine S-methyltransferase
MSDDVSIVSSFSSRIYTLLLDIPMGRVVTYKELARAAGCHSCQAVGQALRRNPNAPEVPCHRVIRSDLRIGGYAGATQGKMLQRKQDLLASEGVVFCEGKLCDPKQLWSFETDADNGAAASL